MTVKLSPVFQDAQLDSSGNPYVGAKLFTFAAGSTTKQTAFQDSAGLTQHTNPIILNSRGEPPAPIWITAGLTYKLYLTTPTDTDPPVTSVRVIDNVSGVNDTTSAIDEWIASNQTPTYISATSFSVSGDQTATYMKRRRLKSTNTAGTGYSSVVGSSFAASITTVTVANDVGSNTLDSGLSAISLGIVRGDNPSIDPDMVHRKGTAVASAATCDIWSTAADYVHITGSTGPITSFGTAPYAGAERTVIFDSTPTITPNSTTLQLPGQQSIVVAAGARAVIRADTTTNMIMISYTPPGGVAVPRSYLAGLTMSTAGASATMSVAAGQATDSTNAVVMSLAAAISKTTSAWAVGTGNGGLDTGAIANNTWYHFHLIMRPDTGVVDVLISLSPSAPAMPSGYTYSRRIGSGKTNGSAQWVKFIQDGDYFRLDASVLDVNTAAPGTAAVTATLASVPTGVNVFANFTFEAFDTAGVQGVHFSDLAVADEAPAASTAPLQFIGSVSASNAGGYGTASIRTNTSAQIRYRLNAGGAGVTIRIATMGWNDRRGRDS